jgi:hypothetical protein
VYPIALAAGLIATQATAAPGDHIRAGDAEIVPSVGLGFDYRGNVYRSELDPTPGGSVTFRPAVDVDLVTDQTSFQVGGYWMLRKYVFVGEVANPTLDLEPSERVSNLDRFNAFNAGFALDAFRQKSVGLRLGNQATLRNNNADADYARAPFTTQFQNKLNGGLRLSPGDALDFVPGGEWIYENYLVPGLESAEQFNTRNTYGPSLSVNWRFLPRTALLFDVNYMLYRWSENVVDASGGATVSPVGNDLALPDSDHLKALTGLQGQFTEKIYFDITAGYGFANYDEASASTGEDAESFGADLQGLDGLLLNTQLRYRISEGLLAALGYRRDFTDSFFTNYVTYDMVYARMQGQFGKFSPAAMGSVRFERYDGEIGRTDALGRVSLDAGYAVTDYARLATGFWWQQRASNQTNIEYDDWNVNVAATFAY